MVASARPSAVAASSLSSPQGPQIVSFNQPRRRRVRQGDRASLRRARLTGARSADRLSAARWHPARGATLRSWSCSRSRSSGFSSFWSGRFGRASSPPTGPGVRGVSAGEIRAAARTGAPCAGAAAREPHIGRGLATPPPVG